MEQCLGGDGTVLFEKYHSWVNLEGLIGPLLLGFVRVGSRRRGVGHDHHDGSGGGYLKGIVEASDDDESDEENDTVLPTSSAAASGNTTTTSNVEFRMPKPRPSKGSNVPSLLGACEDENEDEEKLL